MPRPRTQGAVNNNHDCGWLKNSYHKDDVVDVDDVDDVDVDDVDDVDDDDY